MSAAKEDAAAAAEMQAEEYVGIEGVSFICSIDYSLLVLKKKEMKTCLRLRDM